MTIHNYILWFATCSQNQCHALLPSFTSVHITMWEILLSTDLHLQLPCLLDYCPSSFMCSERPCLQARLLLLVELEEELTKEYWGPHKISRKAENRAWRRFAQIGLHMSPTAHTPPLSWWALDNRHYQWNARCCCRISCHPPREDSLAPAS